MSDAKPFLSKLTPMIPAGKDMQASLNFYEKTLGFTAVYKESDLSMAILQRGDTEIMLQNYDDEHVASQTAFRIQTTAVDDLYAEYQAQKIPPFSQPDGAGLGTLQATPWGTREFAIRDLAGVCITFYERQ